jgi:hypothetical protein
MFPQLPVTLQVYVQPCQVLTREGVTVYSTSPTPQDKECIVPFAPSVQYLSPKTPSCASGCLTGKSYPNIAVSHQKPDRLYEFYTVQNFNLT